MANPVERVLRPVDRWQQEHRGPAFVYGVVKKYGDDRGGTLAAMVAFYGFLSLFPLLLVAWTVLGYLLVGHPGLQHSIERSALRDVPVIGQDLKPGQLHGSVLALVIGLVTLLWGAQGVAQAVQYAVNEAWNVPNRERPGFLPRLGRSAGFFGLLFVALLGTTALSALGSIVGHSRVAGEVAGGLGILGAVVVNIAVFLAVFKLLGPRDAGWRVHLPGAVLAGIGWQILQSVGTDLVTHDLKNASRVYGQFAVVIGLISFLSLASQLVMYSVEVNSVRARRLWPRSIMQPPLLDADRRVLEHQAKEEERRPEERVGVSWSGAAQITEGEEDGPARSRPLRARRRS